MLQRDPALRPTLADIRSHPWTQGPVADIAQVRAQLKERKAKIV